MSYQIIIILLLLLLPWPSSKHAVPLAYSIYKGNLLRTKTLAAHLDSRLGEDLIYSLATRPKTHLTGQVYAGARVWVRRRGAVAGPGGRLACPCAGEACRLPYSCCFPYGSEVLQTP